MADSISIVSPATGDTVASPFTISGTYTSVSPRPRISVVLKDAGGNVVAIGGPVTAAGGNWSAPITPPQGYTDASLFAEINQTTNTSVGSLTVE